jgi:uncharacterized protein (DUF2062 family)
LRLLQKSLFVIPEIRDKFREILKVKDTPHRIAMAFALGVFMGISPLLGLHTIGAFFIAWLLRLNRLVAIIGVYITNPWTIVPIYTFCLWVGAKLTGLERIIPTIGWNDVTLMVYMSELKPLIKPFLVGTIVVGSLSAVISYFIINWAVVKYRNAS